jgi:hypothetical protein
MAGIAAMREDGIVISNIRCLSIATAGWPGDKKISPSSLAGWLPIIIDTLTLGNAGYGSYCASQILGERYRQIVPASLPKGGLDDVKLMPKIRDAWMKEDAAEAARFLSGNPPI